MATGLALAGELDLLSRGVLGAAGQELADRCAESALSHARIDLKDLRFIDAAGLGALVALTNTLAATGTAVTMYNPSASLRRICAICELEELLEPQTSDDRSWTDGNRPGWRRHRGARDRDRDDAR